MTEISEKLSEILPCPFCGSDDLSFYSSNDNCGFQCAYISCNNCFCKGPCFCNQIDHEPDNNVRKAWNDRK